jgi:hypothetical protein
MSEPKGTLDTSVNVSEDPPGVFDGDAWVLRATDLEDGCVIHGAAGAGMREPCRVVQQGLVW